MSDEKSLTVVQNLTPDTWRMITEIAPAMHSSRLFGVASPEQAMAIMLKGYELGLSLTASFEFVQVIQGKPTLSPRGALALVQQSPNFDGMKVTDEPDKCTVWMKRKNGFEYTVTFTIEDAKQAQLIKPDSGWDKYPANMLRWRAIGYCIDVVFPDVIGGMKRSDDLGVNITPEGDVWQQPPVVVEIKPEVSKDKPEPKTNSPEPKEEIPQYGWTLQQLLENVPDADVMAVNNNEIPVTDEQVNLTVHRLKEAGKISMEKEDDTE